MVAWDMINFENYLSDNLLFLSEVTDFDVLSLPTDEVDIPSALLIASRILFRILGSFNFFSSIIIRLLPALLITDVDIPDEFCPGDFARS